MISGKDRRVGVGLTGLLLVALGPFNAWANADAVETARLLAVLLDSGRVTVGMNQELINDPSKGYKGFTPEVFEKQVLAVFQQRTGVDLTTIDRATVPEVAKPLLSRLLEESKKTIASYQTVMNIAGLKDKGLIPATFGTETAHRFENWSGVYLKQTAPERLLRNPKNQTRCVRSGRPAEVRSPRLRFREQRRVQRNCRGGTDRPSHAAVVLRQGVPDLSRGTEGRTRHHGVSSGRRKGRGTGRCDQCQAADSAMIILAFDPDSAVQGPLSDTGRRRSM